MKIRSLSLIWGLLAILLTVPAGPAAALEELPEAVGYVSDFGNIIEPDIEAKITAICQELDHATGAEIAIATFPGLEGEQVDKFTARLFEAWMPGHTGFSGVLIVETLAEQQIYVDVGYELEDLNLRQIADRVRRDVMVPLFEQGKHGEAQLALTAALADKIARAEGVTLHTLAGVNAPQQDDSRSGKISWLWPVIGIVFVLDVIAFMFYLRVRKGKKKKPRKKKK